MARKMTFEAWVDKYRPVRNHIDPNAACDGLMFETYGAENDHITRLAKSDPARVWTELDCDGKLVIVNGWHYVNRFGYYVTEVPHEGPDVEIRAD